MQKKETNSSIKCTLCKTYKKSSDFYIDKTRSNGLNSKCKECSSLYLKEWRSKNINKIKEKKKEYNKTNREKIALWNKEYYFNNKESVNLANKKYKYNNRLKLREKQKEYSRLNNEKLNAYKRTYNKNKRLKSPMFRLEESMSSSIYQSLKKNKAGRRWEQLVGYTLSDLMKHIENKFEHWMSWDNYGLWHIDHIKPKSLFKYTNPEDDEFKECWSLKNLQPLLGIENIKKSNKY